MATIKSYTDISQSKKLAEILPLESADMEYLTIKETGALVAIVPFVKDDSEVKDSAYSYTYDRIFCWSLAALLDILTEQDFTIKAIENEFNIDIPIRHCKIWFPSLLDAAFEMVIWLKKNNKI